MELLKMSGKVKVKPFFFISTVGVFDNSEKVKESSSLPPVSSLGHLSGYSQSKWVVERRLLHAVKRHFPITIFRPGNHLDWSWQQVTSLATVKLEFWTKRISLFDLSEGSSSWKPHLKFLTTDTLTWHLSITLPRESQFFAGYLL